MIPTRSAVPSKTAAGRALAGKIKNLFETGFTADEQTLAFIETTFGCVDAGSLSQLLNDPDNFEAETLVDLIISPDRAVAAGLEEFLAEAGFEEGDEQKVCSFLPESLATSMRFPDGRGVVSFTVFEASLVRFVKQLRIACRIPADIRRELRLYFSDSHDHLAALVAVRHSRVSWSDEKAAFLARFARQTATTAKAEWVYDLMLILDILSRIKSVDNVLAALAAEKANCRRQLEAAERFEQALARNNIETLMMRKSRGGVLVDKQPLFYRIGRVDIIGWKVFGKPPPEEDGDGGEPD